METNRDIPWMYETHCAKCGKEFEITHEEHLLRQIFGETSMCPECDKYQEEAMANT